MVSCLTFRSFIHFEFMFAYGIKKWSNFTHLHVAVQFSQHHLLKTFSHCTFFPALLKINRLYSCGFISGFFHSLPFIYVYFYVSSILFYHYSFVILKSSDVMPPALISFFKYALAIWCLFLCLFLRERERERESANRGKAEREGDTESEACSRL